MHEFLIPTYNKYVSYKSLMVYCVTILNKYIMGYCFFHNILCMFVKFNAFINFISLAKFNLILRFDALMDISVVDYPNRLRRFELNYVFLSYKTEHRIIVKLFTDNVKPVCSINNIYPSSNWLEREVWDMFGIKFLFHPNLRRILTDYGFKGHPLRKDFPLSGYIDIYYNDSTQTIAAAPLEISQNMRFYHFENS